MGRGDNLFLFIFSIEIQQGGRENARRAQNAETKLIEPFFQAAVAFFIRDGLHFQPSTFQHFEYPQHLVGRFQLGANGFNGRLPTNIPDRLLTNQLASKFFQIIPGVYFWV